MGEWKSVQRPAPPTTSNQWGKSFYRQRRGLRAETAQSALTVILKLVVSGLTGVILIVFSTVKLQFPSQFVSISLRPVLRIVATQIVGAVWLSCN